MIVPYSDKGVYRKDRWICPGWIRLLS